ncbi:MAG TPA: YciI family protein [Gaiellaceae bacterium]
MRVMVLVKANEESEAGEMPSTEALAEMGEFNEELVKAGVMLAGEGIAPTSRGKRIQFDGPSGRRVIDGPFTETKELIAGYWLWEVKTMDEAVEWLKRAPFQEGVVEIRPVLEEADFGEEFTPELRDQERRIREQAEQNK